MHPISHLLEFLRFRTSKKVRHKGSPSISSRQVFIVRAIVLECKINTFPLLTQQPPFIRQHQFSRAEIRPVTCAAIRPSIFRLNGRAWAEFLVASRAITAKQTLINANNSPKNKIREQNTMQVSVPYAPSVLGGCRTGHFPFSSSSFQ